METIQIVNMKCGGCQKTIKKELEKQGFENVSVNLENQEIKLEGDKSKACEILSKLGYPQKGSTNEKSLFKKTKSFVSCASGKFSQ
jgi:copper chaperone CopZ